jgi:hypothetical protein
MLAFELSKLPNSVILGAVAVLGILLLTRANARRIKGKTGVSAEEAKTRIPSLREQVEVKDHLQKLMVQLQELARQINGHIDTRFCKLEVLLREADQKIRQLESMGLQPAGPLEPPATLSSDLDREIIYKLADAGKSPLEIARELQKNTGEIELILSLRRSAGKNGPKIDYRIGD